MRVFAAISLLLLAFLATVSAECKTDVQEIEISDPNVDLNILEKINVLVAEGSATLDIKFQEIEGTKLKIRVEAQYDDEKVEVGNFDDITFDAEAQTIQQSLSMKGLENTGAAPPRSLPAASYAAAAAVVAAAPAEYRRTVATVGALAVAATSLPGALAQECPTKFTVTILYPRGSRWSNQELAVSGKEAVIKPPIFGKPCFSDPVCKRKGGKCVMRKEQCPEKSYFVSSLCGNDITNPFFSNSAKPLGCGCCIPEDPEPTPQPTRGPTRTELPPICFSENNECELNNGFCVRHPVMCPDTHFFKQDLCKPSDPFVGQISTCGCCLPKQDPPTPEPTKEIVTEAPTPEQGVCDFREDVCKKKGGKCVKTIKECPSSVGLFVKEICRNPEKPNAECGCCIRHETRPPTPPPISPVPCFHDKRCPAFFKGGRCVKNRRQCPPNWKFDPHFCHRDDTQQGLIDIVFAQDARNQCGCCYPTFNEPTKDPTPRPTRSPLASQGECDKDDKCTFNNGFCVEDKSQCPDDNMHIFHADLCNTEGKECGCCRKLIITEPPTVPKPCLDDRRCAEEGGKCVETKDQCDLAAGFEFDTSKCNSYQSHNDPDKCGCCKPKSTPPPATPPPTFEECVDSPRCEEGKGKCVRKRADCPSDMIFNPQLCRKIDATGALVGECGCCMPYPTKEPTRPPTPKPTIGEPCINNDEACADKPGGFCVQNYASCPTDMIYEPGLCTLSPNTQNSCGCCYRDEAEPTKQPTRHPTQETCPADDICESQNGFCFENTAANNEKCQTVGTVFVKMCGFDEKCACCIKKPDDTRKPTPKPTPHPVEQCLPEDERCADKQGRCVRTEKDCTSYEFFTPKFCNIDNTYDPKNPCGCCIPHEPTKAPTLPEPCKQDDTCTRSGGKCVRDYRECDPDIHDIDREKCTADPTSASTCACCTPKLNPTQPPTEQKCGVNSEKCAFVNGFCQDIQFRCPVTHWSSTEYCNEDSTKPECQCCVPIITKQPTRRPTIAPQQVPCFQDERCKKHLGGFCVKDNRQCPDNMFFTPRYCTKVDAAGNIIPSDCGCCFPRQKTESPTRPNDIPCKDDEQCKSTATVEQKCVSSKRECPTEKGFFFDQTRCKTDGNGECGCCGREIQPEPCADDPKCTFNHGFCFEVTEESKKKCVENGLEINPEMCGSTEDCACCLPPTQTEPPTIPQECFNDERCADRNGKCVEREEDCKIDGYFFNPELCTKPNASGVKCGCCMKG